MKRHKDSIELSQLFSLMRNYKNSIFCIVGISTCVALLIAFVLPKEYESTTLVQTRSATKIDISGAAAAMALLGGGNIASNTINYIELMKSRTVLEPIIDTLDFEEDERPEAKKFAKKYLEIKNTKGTNLIEVIARWESPEEAQRISQSVVNNFLLMQTNMNQQTQSLLMKFLDNRINLTKVDVEAAEEKLAEFSREHKLYSPDGQAKAAIEQMAAFDKAIAEVEVAIRSAQASIDATNAKLDEQKTASKEYNISDNETVQKIRDQIVAKRIEIVRLEQNYTDIHPSVQQANRELEELQEVLKAEVIASVDSETTTLNPTQSQLFSSLAMANVNLAVALASDNALKEQQSKWEEELGSFPDDVMEYMRLSRDVKVKTEVYLSLVTQYEQKKLQAAMDSMDIQIVDMANLPDIDKPVSPKKLLLTAIGFVIGIFIALGYSLNIYRREVE